MDEPATKTPSPDEGEGSKPAHSYRWLLLVGALFVVAIKVVRCAKHEGEPAAHDPVTAHDGEKQAAQVSPVDCAAACKRDCLGSSDPLAQQSCLRTCDERCGIGGDEDGVAAPSASASAR
jgi:hypothetical protein